MIDLSICPASSRDKHVDGFGVSQQHSHQVWRVVLHSSGYHCNHVRFFFKQAAVLPKFQMNERGLRQKAHVSNKVYRLGKGPWYHQNEGLGG